MTQEFTQLEQRIKAAFDRMDRGLEALARARAVQIDRHDPSPSAPAPGLSDDPPAHMAALLRALESAKSSASDWAQRFANLQKQSSEDTLAMANEITRLTEELEMARAQTAIVPAASTTAHDDEIDALTARLAEQEAELETLRAARAADARELGELIDQLSPLVEEAANV